MKRALEGKNSVLSPTIERSGLYEKSIELIKKETFQRYYGKMFVQKYGSYYYDK